MHTYQLSLLRHVYINTASGKLLNIGLLAEWCLQFIEKSTEFMTNKPIQGYSSQHGFTAATARSDLQPLPALTWPLVCVTTASPVARVLTLAVAAENVPGVT